MVVVMGKMGGGVDEDGGDGDEGTGVEDVVVVVVRGG